MIPSRRSSTAGAFGLRPAPALLIACLVWMTGMTGMVAPRADEPVVAPLPPSPEEPAVVQPAAFESPAAAAVPQPSITDAPLPLSQDPARPPAGGSAARPIRPLGDWTVLAAIGAAFLVLAAFRLRPLRRPARLPPDVFELLGEGSLGGAHAVRVVRFGPRTLLVGVSSAGCQTLAEIDDAQATERIVAACQGERPPLRRPPPLAAAPARSGPAAGEAT